MNMSGDASEQVVRMCLEGFEITAKITGAAVERVVAALYAIAKNKADSHKADSMKSKLKHGGKMEILTLKDEDVAKFKKGAKIYGLKNFVPVRDKKVADGMSDLYIDPSQASIAEQIIKRFGLTAAKTTMETEARELDKEAAPAVSEKEADDLAFQLLSGGKEAETPETDGENPISARTDALNPSNGSLQTSKDTSDKRESVYKALEAAKRTARKLNRKRALLQKQRNNPNKKKDRSK